MSGFQQQLAILRNRMARIDRKYEPRTAAQTPAPSRRFIELCLSGEEVETAYGRHFETEKLYEAHRQHGSADIGALADLPHDLFKSISNGSVSDASPESWAFLDTETTGLVDGSGTCAFLIGVGRIAREGFRVRQFFMRNYSEEASLLDAVARHLAQFRILITYNGLAFDQPLLEARYRLNRARAPFTHLEHLDLLHGARRLWKLRFESCRLVDLENAIFGIERQGDLAGALIPYIYFEYLHTREAARMLPVFHHNCLDILTLACLTGVVPQAFDISVNCSLRHGAEILGIARWLRQAGELDQALILFRRAIEAGLSDNLLFPTLWDIGTLERRLGVAERGLAIWRDLAAAKNPYRARALEELAKHYEHREKNYAMALEMTRSALVHGDSDDLRKRELRLRTRMERKKTLP